MGNDAALAVLSDKPRMLYDYFKQRFAQVTNPAIDSIREEVIMALDCYCGPERNLLEATQEHAHRLRIPHPILSNEELAAIKHLDYRGWRTAAIDITYEAGSGAAGLAAALDRICAEASRAIEQRSSLILLSDRAVGPERVPISALLAVGAVHHHLVETCARTRIGIIVETGEAREVHHHCLLIGYGADAINPYLAFEALWASLEKGYFSDAPHVATRQDVVDAYRKGAAKGMLKVMAKMGISTLQSYKGAQIFEAVGLADDIIERAFKGTASRCRAWAWRFSPRSWSAATRWAIQDATAISRCCPIMATSIGAGMAKRICGTRRPSPTCRWPPGPTTRAPTGASPTTRTGKAPPRPACAGFWLL